MVGVRVKHGPCDACGNVEDRLIGVPTEDGNKYICKECRRKYGCSIKDDAVGDVMVNLMTPEKIVQKLDEKVKGQHDAKKTIAVAVYNHYMRICHGSKVRADGKTFKKNNIMMTGPTGTGKTFMIETLAELLGVPYTMVTATTLSETGYVGNDVENILTSLYKASGNDLTRAECGIVFIDEIDKIARKGENMSITRDVSGEGVQKALLRMIQGDIVGFPANGGRIHPQQQLLQMNTSDVLFICGGAFAGIEDIVKKRLKVDSSSKAIGFGVNRASESEKKEFNNVLRSKIESDDLEKFGMIPELVGRLPIVCNLEQLSRGTIFEILKSRHGILDEYKTMFELMGKKLIIKNDALQVIAEDALSKEYGARGLRGVVASALEDVLYKAPSEETVEYVLDKDFLDNVSKKHDVLYLDYTKSVKVVVEKYIEKFILNDIDIVVNGEFVNYVIEHCYNTLDDIDKVEEYVSSLMESIENEASCSSNTLYVNELYVLEYIKR